MTAFHKRAECALKIIHRTRNQYGTFNCKRGGKDVQMRKKLIGIQSELDPILHLTYETDSLRDWMGIQGSDRSPLYRHSQSQILNASLSPVLYSNQVVQQPVNNDLSGILDPRTHGLTEANLQYRSRGISVTEELGDCSSTNAITEDDSTVIANDVVSDSGCEPWCDPQLGAMDLAEACFGQWEPYLCPSNCSPLEGVDYSFKSFEENLRYS